jgi:hypothetical protein
MIEPTESEAKVELDRFCDAMLAIREEEKRVAAGEWPRDDNPLVNAPHPAEDLLADDWKRPYTPAEAAYPTLGAALQTWGAERRATPRLGPTAAAWGATSERSDREGDPGREATSTGRRSRVSTRHTVTATSCARARLRSRSRTPDGGGPARVGRVGAVSVGGTQGEVVRLSRERARGCNLETG